MNYNDYTTRIIECQQHVAETEEANRIAKQRLEEAKKQLIDAMIMGDVPAEFSANGLKWKLDADTFVRPVKEHAQEVVSWISRNGGSDLVQPSMHWARRDAFLRETVLQDDGDPVVPEELAGKLVVDTVPRLKFG